MAISVAALRDEFVAIVGAAHVSDDARVLAANAVDGVTPRWVARPGDAEQVSRLLRLASAERLAVAPRGEGSSVDLGAAPRRLDLVVDCRALAAITNYVPEDMTASVEAGVPLAALAARLGQHRQRWPVDPAWGGARSVGGVLATGASGPLRFRYGAPRDLVLGVRFVQADGTITWGGSRVVKSVTGYDVPKLLVGSLGTLGILTEATIRLHPVLPAEASWLIRFGTAEATGGFVAALLDTAIEPARVALLDAGSSRDSAAGSMAVAVSIESVPEAVTSQGAALARLVAEHDGVAAAARPDLWSGLGATLAAPIRLKLAATLPRLAAWLADVRRRASGLGLTAKMAADAGTGMGWIGLAGSPTADALDGGLLRPVRDGLAAEGGSLVVESAPAALKRGLDVWGPVEPGALAIMARLKREFDPEGILNPGRFVGGL
jgi:glycolate oxidase FAD binding subunit